MPTETVKFDVGGKTYKVSRSLLDQHPNTMLAKSASEKWLEDPESEIFIERDGDVFAHVLDYLRDGRVHLPVTICKGRLLLELEYYGVDNVDGGVINDSTTRAFQSDEVLKRADELLENVKKSYDNFQSFLDESADGPVFTRLCFEEWRKSGGNTNEGAIRKSHYFYVKKSHEVYRSTQSAKREYDNGQLDSFCNDVLRKVGIKVTEVGAYHRCNGVKVTKVDISCKITLERISTSK